MTNIKHGYIIAGIIVLAIIGGCAYITSKVNVARFQQVEADMKPIHQQAKDDKESASKSEDANQKMLAAALAAIAKDKSQPVATSVDYARIEQMIEQRMGAHATVQANPNLPDAPSAIVPAKQLRDYMDDCDAVKAQYGSCKLTTANLQKELDAEKADNVATQKELAAAKKAMKGGGFWSRVKSNSKWLVIGGGVAAGVLCGTGHCK